MRGARSPGAPRGTRGAQLRPAALPAQRRGPRRALHPLRERDHGAAHADLGDDPAAAGSRGARPAGRRAAGLPRPGLPPRRDRPAAHGRAAPDGPVAHRPRPRGHPGPPGDGGGGDGGRAPRTRDATESLAASLHDGRRGDQGARGRRMGGGGRMRAGAPRHPGRGGAPHIALFRAGDGAGSGPAADAGEGDGRHPHPALGGSAHRGADAGPGAVPPRLRPAAGSPRPVDCRRGGSHAGGTGRSRAAGAGRARGEFRIRRGAQRDAVRAGAAAGTGAHRHGARAEERAGTHRHPRPGAHAHPRRGERAA